MTNWATQPMTSFALATTDIDPSTSRIVAIGTRTVNDGINAPARVTVVATPADIPAAASRVHGITNEISAVGTAPKEALEALLAQIRSAADAGHAVVVFNWKWVYNTLAHEARELGVQFELPAYLRVVDPLVLDLGLNSARRSGNRTLPALGRSWQVEQSVYGTAEANADAVLRLAWKIGTSHPKVRNMTLDDLFAAQREWKREADESRETHYLSRGLSVPA